MFAVFGFYDTSQEWNYLGGRLPEEEISGACHIYHDHDGRRFIGFEKDLGMEESEMRELLSPYTKRLRWIRVR